MYISRYEPRRIQMNETTERTIGEMVAERPSRARVFEKFGIDYCCGGKQSLENACRQKGLDAASVAKALEAFEQSDQSGGEQSWATAPLADLIQHILDKHH